MTIKTADRGHGIREAAIMRRLCLIAMAVALVGCGGDGGGATGPDGGSNGPDAARVDGTWRLNWTNMSGSGVSCNVTGMVVTLVQSGQTFVGTGTSSWDVVCMGGGYSGTETVYGATVSNGMIDRAAVSFNLATSDAHQTGTISGATMSGAAAWKIDLGEPLGVVTLNGNWAAVRQ